MGIPTGQAISDVQRFGGAVDAVTAQAIRDLDKIDAATKGVGDMSAATAQMVRFADETAKSAISAARELNRIERAGESMASQLERQLSVFGKTSAEIRTLKAESAALAAEQAKMPELAGRIRDAEQALFEAELEASRRAQQAAAALAQERDADAAAAKREAAAIREAADSYKLFEAVAKQRMGAYRAQESEQAAAAMRAEAVAAQKAAAQHAQLAAAVRGSHDAQEADALAAERLRASTDPLYAATKRLNAEIAESTRLYHAGATAPAEYARQQAVLQQQLRTTTEAHNVNAVAAQKSGFAVKQTLLQMPDIIGGLATGQKPLTVLIQQGGQLVQVAQLAEGGIRGFAAEVGAFALKFLPAIAGLAALYAGFELLKSNLNDDSGLKKYSEGLGLNHDEMKKLKDVSVTTGDVMTGIWRTLNADKSIDSFTSRAKKLFTDLRDSTIMVMRAIGDTIYGTLVGGYRASIETWRQWPGALADLTIQGVNKAIGAVESLLNFTIDGLNKLPGINIGRVDLGRLKNDYAGAGAAVGAIYAKEFTKAAGEADKFFTDAARNIQQAAKDRLKAQADEISFDRRAREAAEARRKADRDAAEAAKKEAEQLERFRKARDDYHYDSMQDTLKQFAAWNKVDLSKGLNSDLKQLDTYFDKNGFGAQMKEQAHELSDFWDKLDKQVSASAANMERAFGRVGGAIGEAMRTMSEYGKEQAAINTDLANQTITQDAARKKSADLQINTVLGLTDAAKNLFGEHSKGYKAMEAAEKALTIVQLARTAVDVAGGAARMFASLGPWAFPAVAAMVGVMASLGFSAGGSGISSSDYTKGNTGSGTVLGDTDAKSESIKRSIDALKEVDTLTNTFAREMSASLKSIDSQIGNLSVLLVRSGNISADNSVTQGFKTNAIGSVLSSIPLIGGFLGSLFGTKTTVIGSGITANAQSLSDILSSGFDGQTYSDVEKKKKFFGITTGTSYSTVLGGSIDDQVANQFTLILKSFNDAILAAAGPLGQSTNAIEGALGNFVFKLGKIDLSGLSGTEIQDKLEAVFGAAADDMAKAAFPFIEEFQKVGEGAFETLTRVASTVEAVTASLDLLGTSAWQLGIGAKMALADQFDSVSAMTSAVDAYFTAYYSKAEQASARTAQLSNVFSSVGLAMPDTLDGFRHLVEAQDLTTAAGRETYATLLKLAPAFADLKTAMEGAKSAADILAERQDLQQKLLELTGDTAAIRAAELAKIDPSNRALQEQIYAIQDAQEAAKAAEQLRSAWKSVGDGILDEVARIRGLTDASTAGGYASILGQFNAATSAARGGDQDAAGKLTGLSRSLLEAAEGAATSRQELDRIQAMTASSLEQTYNIISQFSAAGSSASTASTIAALAASNASASSVAASDSTADLRQEIAGLRAELNSALATIANNTGRTAKTLDTVSAASGGEALTVTGVAA